MANNQSFIPTGLEIVLYNNQEAQNRQCTNKIIVAEPVSWRKPEEVFGAVEGDGSTQKRKRRVSELEVENGKEFSLLELYKSNNIDEIILRQQKDETTLDPQELLNNLKGWTVEKRKRPEENGKDRVDKTYRHPKSKRSLRSLVEVKKFIEENSYIGKASDNSEGGSLQDNIGMAMPRRQLESQGTRPGPSSWYDQSDMHLQIFKKFEEKCNNYTYKGPLSSCWETRRASHANIRGKETMCEVPQSWQISGLPKGQLFTNFMRPNGQQSMRTFGVEPPRYDVLGASSSSTTMASLDEIKMVFQSQVNAQIEARVAAQVAEKVYHYEKTQMEMAERMESMQRLLVLGGMLPPSQVPNMRDLEWFPNTRRS